jgi:hypothetical protein
MEEFKNIQDELRSLNSKLSEMEKKNNFSVPENYFEKLPSLIQDKIAAQKKIPWWKEILASLLSPRFALAACSFLIVIGSFYYFKNINNSSLPANSSMANVDDVDANALANELDETSLTEAYAQAISTEPNNESSDIENYLLDNNVDVNSLTNEL